MKHSSQSRILRVLRAFALGSCVLALGCVSSDTPESRHSDPPQGSFRVASFNIHYVAPWQTALAWERRKDAVVKALAGIEADVIAFQEMETFAGGSFNDENRQLDWVLAHFPEYAAGAVGDPRTFPSTQPILYKRSRFTQLEQGYFFFSDTPEVMYSATFNGSYPAFCSWSKLQIVGSDTTVYVYNVHYDYKSFKNRRLSNALVLERVRPVLREGEHVIVAGDINAFSFSPTARALKGLPLALAPPSGATYHFNRGVNLLPAIDHIFYSEGLQQHGDTVVERVSYDGIWPADHYPIWIQLKPQRDGVTRP